MPLEHVLSAMRTLILDPCVIPQEYDERRRRYEEWFPLLNADERDDLARIPVEKLRLYTSTIFTGEGNVLKNHFKITLYFLKKAWQDVRGKELKMVPLAQFVHEKKPWKSHQTKVLVQNFAAVVRDHMPDMTAHSPWLPDCAALEAAGVVLKRLPDYRLPEAAVDMSSLNTFTVEDVLNLRLTVTPHTTLHTFTYNVVSLFDDYHGQGLRKPEAPALQITPALGTRGADKAIRWLPLEAGIHEIISESMQAPHTVERLASYCLHKPDATEESALTELLQTLFTLQRAGALILCR